MNLGTHHVAIPHPHPPQKGKHALILFCLNRRIVHLEMM